MKKFIFAFIFALLFFINIPFVRADNNIDLYFFYGDGCPHCEKEEKFLERLQKEKDNINIHYFGNNICNSIVIKSDIIINIIINSYVVFTCKL